MQYPQGFVLKDCSLECWECRSVFAMRVLADLPPVTVLDKIEADLHRVLPHPALRGALIAVCPSCGNADWATKFKRSILNPNLAVATPDIEHCRKFAMAVKHAREQRLQPLDIAYIALNGLYCARESQQPDDAWLELCIYEQSRGLNDEDLVVKTGHDHLVMAELWRQMGMFDNAIAEYQQARTDASIPEELIRQQLNAARASDRQPTLLPPALVRIIYPDAVELLETGVVTPEVLQKPIVQEPNPLFCLEPDEQTGLLKPAAVEERPAWAANGRFDLPVEPEFEIDEQTRAALAEMASSSERQVEEQAKAPTPEPAPTIAEHPARPIEEHQAPPAVVPVAAVPHLIAVPECASTVSLVHSADSTSVTVALNAVPVAMAQPAAAQASATQPPAAQPSAAQEPRAPEPPDRTHTAVNRALKVVNANDDNDRLPTVQLFDDEYSHLNDVPALNQQQAAAAPATKNPQEAIAQVESFLNLTRQPGYQNWIRGYRR